MIPSLSDLTHFINVFAYFDSIRKVIMYKDNQAVEYDALEPYPGHFHHYLPWLRWTPSSSLMLQEAEQNIVKFLKTPSEASSKTRNFTFNQEFICRS